MMLVITAIIITSIYFVNRWVQMRMVEKKRETLLKVVNSYQDNGWLYDKESYRKAIRSGYYDAKSPQELNNIMEEDEYVNWTAR